MKQEPQHKRHSSSQLGELAGTAVRNAQERRGRVLAAAELESATGGAISAVLLDYNIRGGILADKLQVGGISAVHVSVRGAAVALDVQAQFGR